MRKIITVLLLANLAHAISTVAVLEIVSGGDTKLKISEYRHLTDELRTRAREVLPQNDYTVLTRDNILQLLPPDEKEAECLAESCAVDIGRAIGAEYVSQGFVGTFGDMLTLTVELYESMSGNLLGSFVTESNDAMGLLRTVRKKAPDLYARILKSTSGKSFPSTLTPKLVVAKTETKPDTAISVSANNQQVNLKLKELNLADTQTGKGISYSFWGGIALEVLGAAAITYGYTREREVASLQKKYRSLGSNATEQEFEEVLKKANDTKTTRNVFYILGGAFLAAGIGVHIWF